MYIRNTRKGLNEMIQKRKCPHCGRNDYRSSLLNGHIVAMHPAIAQATIPMRPWSERIARKVR